VNVTDRFLGELSPVALGQVPKDLDMKYENLVKGIRHIQIKVKFLYRYCEYTLICIGNQVWPPEAFEEGAEFMESLSKSFEHAHGLRLKTAFAETLVHLLHPIGKVSILLLLPQTQSNHHRSTKTAQAEVNHPQWAKAIETIYPKAKDMMSKPRYWHVAYPLTITSLCVAPQQFFLRNWTTCFEAGLQKLKVYPSLSISPLIIDCHASGKGVPGTSYEWHDAATLDLFVSMPGTSVYYDIQA
jgi:hypothetical protein